MQKRLLGLLASAAIVFAACGGSASNPPATVGPAASGATGSAGASAPAVTSANFAFALDGEPTYFSLAYTDLPTSWVVGLIYTGMYRANNKLDVVPDMATALPTVSADGLTWTIKLKNGITWQDGTPFTADDVVFTFQLAASKNCTFIPSFCSDIQGNVATVSATDPSTVVFTLKAKYAPFLITDLTTPIMPKKAVTDSFTKFQTAAGKADAAAVKAEVDKVSKATGDKACDGSKTQPTTCLFAGYADAITALLQAGGITLPDQNAYKAADGTVDKEGYGQALFTQLQDLSTALTSSQTDQIAAAFRILDFQRNPIGTGPYKFVKYTAGDSVDLAAFSNYYAGAVGPQQVHIPIIKDNASEAAALQKGGQGGGIDWMTEITSDALSTLQGDQNITVTKSANFGYYFIAFNLRPGHIYSDQNLRTAFTMCIDHDATVNKATDGTGIPVYADIPPASWAYDPNVPKYTLDVAGAKKLIEQSGWTLGSDGIYAKGGQRLSTTLYVRAGKPQRISFAQLAADQLKACGIEISVKPADFSTVLLPLLSYPNKFDTYLGGWSTALDPDDSSIFGCDQIVTKTNPDANNFVGWCNKQADALLTQGRQTTDQAARKTIYAQFQTIVHNDVPYYFLWSDTQYAGLQKTVQATSNSVTNTDQIDTTSPLYYWNNDSWIVKTQ